MRTSQNAAISPLPPILQAEVEQQTTRLREALACNNLPLHTSISITSHGQEKARTICRLRMPLPDGLTLGCEGQGTDASSAIRQAFLRMTRLAAFCMSWVKRRARQSLAEMDSFTR